MKKLTSKGWDREPIFVANKEGAFAILNESQLRLEANMGHKRFDEWEVAMFRLSVFWAELYYAAHIREGTQRSYEFHRSTLADMRELSLTALETYHDR